MVAQFLKAGMLIFLSSRAGLVSGRWQFLTPLQNPHPLTDHQKVGTGDPSSLTLDKLQFLVLIIVMRQP